MPVLDQLIEQYPEKIKIVFKHFPLRNHQFAAKAAQAAVAADRQGQFWAFHDELFTRYNRLNDQAIDQIMTDLHLDAGQFRADMQASATIAQVNADIVDGNQAGVRGTPTVFINGRLLRDKSLAGFQAMINALIRQKVAAK